MNIPLNIDWQQILLHLLNFSVLTLGLYLLLYKPITNFMEKRAEHYRNLDTQAEDKIKQAKELELSYKKRLECVETEIEENKARAAQEAKLAADALLESANEQALKIISDARQAALQERAKILEEAQQEIASMAIAATEKLLTQSASDTLDQFLYAVKKE